MKSKLSLPIAFGLFVVTSWSFSQTTVTPDPVNEAALKQAGAPGECVAKIALKLN